MKRLFYLMLSALFVTTILAGSLTERGNAAKITGESAKPEITLKIGKKDVTKKTHSLNKGSKAAVKASVSNLNGKKKISYASSDKKIVPSKSKATILNTIYFLR